MALKKSIKINLVQDQEIGIQDVKRIFGNLDYSYNKFSYEVKCGRIRFSEKSISISRLIEILLYHCRKPYARKAGKILSEYSKSITFTPAIEITILQELEKVFSKSKGFEITHNKGSKYRPDIVIKNAINSIIVEVDEHGHFSCLEREKHNLLATKSSLVIHHNPDKDSMFDLIMKIKEEF